MSHEDRVSELLTRWSDGDADALDELVPLVYDELRRLARIRLKGERSDHTLGTTGLVHEAYLRLVGIDRMTWTDRAHFLAMASRTMRRVLVDYAEQRNARKRGGDLVKVPLEEDPATPAGFAVAVLDLSQALDRLEGTSPRAARILEQRYFGGLTLEETAAVLDVSLATVKRDLQLARAWIARELRSPQIADVPGESP